MQYEKDSDTSVLPAVIVAAAAKVQAAVAELMHGLHPLRTTAELAAAARELGSTYRQQGIGPERALIHLRRLLPFREYDSRRAQRVQRWVSRSLGWILEGYYGSEGPPGTKDPSPGALIPPGPQPKR
jgi:hypothetical protein